MKVGPNLWCLSIAEIEQASRGPPTHSFSQRHQPKHVATQQCKTLPVEAWFCGSRAVHKNHEPCRVQSTACIPKSTQLCSWRTSVSKVAGWRAPEAWPTNICPTVSNACCQTRMSSVRRRHRHHDVGRLYISVDDAPGMQIALASKEWTLSVVAQFLKIFNSTCLSVYLTYIYLSAYLSVSVSVYRTMSSISLPLSFYLHVYLSFYLSTDLHPSIYLSL